MNKRNPFVTSGYVSPEYFCDREKETTQIMIAENEEKKERMMRESQELLRWQAETDFKDGAKETVSYFVAKIDAENRRKTELKNNDFKVTKEEEKREKRYEVEIEEEDKEEKEIQNPPPAEA